MNSTHYELLFLPWVCWAAVCAALLSHAVSKAKPRRVWLAVLLWWVAVVLSWRAGWLFAELLK
mgnify:CR=1 FL=1